MRVAALILIVGCLSALARSQTMPGESPEVPPEPRQLFLDTIHGLQTAKTLDVRVERRHRMEPATVLTDPQQQRAAAMADDYVDAAGAASV
jgi:hypothetical protein